MGVFDYFKNESDKRAEDVRTGAVAPSRSERQQCYLARDAYFACLDANGIVDALEDDARAAKVCGPQGAVFKKDCAAQWVSSNPTFLTPPPFPRGIGGRSRTRAHVSGNRYHTLRNGAYKTFRRRRD